MASELVEKYADPDLWDLMGRKHGDEATARILAAFEREAKLAGAMEMAAWGKSHYPEDVFLPKSESQDAKAAAWARRLMDGLRDEARRRYGQEETT